MKKTKIKSRMTFLSVLLALALIFTAMPLTASAENEEASAVNTGTSGEYTVSQLANMQVPDEDIPATLTRADIDAKDHAVRLRSEEPNDATVIFQNRDGSRTAYIYMTPVKYTDENGITRDKSSEITAFSGAYNGKHYAYAMKDNDVKVYFSRVGTDGITLSAAGYDIKMIPENTTSLLIPAATLVDENTLRYNGVYGLGTDIEYTSILNGVKENIVLSRYAGVNSYTFMLHTDGLILMNNGADYYLVDTAGKRVASIGRVIAEDSAGNTVYGTMTAVTVRAGAQYIVNVAVDEGFLTDEDTVYPVKIDPTVTIDQGDTGYIYDRIQDTGLYGTNSALYGLTDNVYPVGYISSVVGVGRMAIRFPMFVDPWADYMSQFYSGVADIKGYQISSASLSLYAKRVFGSTYIEIYPMTSAPSFGMPRREQNTNLMNSYSTAYSASKPVSSAGRQNFDVTGIVKGWADYDFNNPSGVPNPVCGLILKNENESDESKGVEFYSAYYYLPDYQPELSITYDNTYGNETYYINNSGSGKFLSVAGSSATSNSYTTGNELKWYFDSIGNSEFLLRNASDRTKILYSNNGTLSIKSLAYGAPSSDIQNQYKWKIERNTVYNDYWYITNVENNKVIRSTSSGLTMESKPSTNPEPYSTFMWRIIKSSDYVNLTSFSVLNVEVNIGETQNINMSISPANATWASLNDFNITSSSYDNVMSLNKGNGILTGLKPADEMNFVFTHKVTNVSYSDFKLTVTNSVKIIAINNPSNNPSANTFFPTAESVGASLMLGTVPCLSDVERGYFSKSYISDCLQTSNIMVLSAHGGSDTSGTYMKIGENSTDLFSSSDILEMDTDSLDYLKIVVFSGCQTGKTISNGYNLPKAAVARGADVAIGFKTNEQIAMVNIWIKTFLLELKANSETTVEEAAIAACTETANYAEIQNTQEPEEVMIEHYVPIDFENVTIEGDENVTLSSAIQLHNE